MKGRQHDEPTEHLFMVSILIGPLVLLYISCTNNSIFKLSDEVKEEIGGLLLFHFNLTSVGAKRNTHIRQVLRRLIDTDNETAISAPMDIPGLALTTVKLLIHLVL